MYVCHEMQLPGQLHAMHSPESVKAFDVKQIFLVPSLQVLCKTGKYEVILEFLKAAPLYPLL